MDEVIWDDGCGPEGWTWDWGNDIVNPWGDDVFAPSPR